MRWLATSARSWAVGSSLRGWKRRTLGSARHWRRRSASRGAAGRNVTWGLDCRSGNAMALILAASSSARSAGPARVTAHAAARAPRSRKAHDGR